MPNLKGPTLGNGKICYVEIPATDMKISSAFYQTVFSWNVRTRSDGHIAFDDGIGETSGTWIKGRKPSVEPGLLVSIMVDSVAETVEKIKANGCSIIKQAEIGPDQFIAWFSDPGGNTMGIYQHPGGGHGKICYIEIPADDIPGSAEFYKAILRWHIRSDNEGNAAFDDGVEVVSGMWEPGLKPHGEPGLLVYIMMDDVAATMDKIIAAGGKIIQPIGGDAPEITARFSDPFGNIWGLYQEKALKAES
jgi:uncharacterized protein